MANSLQTHQTTAPVWPAETAFRLIFLPQILLLFVLASRTSSVLAQQTATPQPLTWDHVYGIKKFDLVPDHSTSFIWVSDTEYISEEPDGWRKYDTEKQESSPWYDPAVLATALQSVSGVSADDAMRMAHSEWKLIHHAQRIALFESKNSYIRITLDGTQRAVVQNLPAKRELEELSPDGSAVAFICENELWMADFRSCTVKQLTQGASQSIRNGKADWIYYEEILGRSWRAFRWSPDSRKLVFQQFDDRPVSSFSVSSHVNVQPTFETEFYPKAGNANPVTRLGVVAVNSSSENIVWLESAEWPEHDRIISGFQWEPDSKSVLWYAQNRTQTFLDVVRSNAETGQSLRLLRDQTQAWVESPGAVHFLADGSFLMFSDRTGWRHLYRVSREGRHISPVTSGDWDVKTLHTVTTDQTLAFVSGTRDSRIAENLYRIRLNHSSNLDHSSNTVSRLTPDDGHHGVSVSPGGSFFLDTCSSLQVPERVSLWTSGGQEVRVLQEESVVPRDQWRLGELRLQELPMADGTETTAILTLPPEFDATKKYPVWLMIYGGPRYPMVKNAWQNRMPEHLLANQGIVVVRFDPRTASGYGARSAWNAYRQLGVEETRDIESVCDWLASRSWVDADRIGMSGSSYGGYLTAYAMTHSKRLCAGVAVASVTDWANYDSIYTERYMSTPDENPDGYRRSSVVRAASDLHGRLLIIHGMMDDNVHPENSFQLIHELQKANRGFEMMLYPTAKHGISGTHFERLVYQFILKSLGLPGASPR